MSGAAIATKKPHTSEQLTFPAVFQEVYDKPLAYAPSGMGPRMTPYAGDDFQADYHQQKKRDADYMAKAKVMATINARHKYVVSPHGYFGMPKPELSQRKFANPSGGALSIHSARQDGSVYAPFELVDGGLSGGVLRTAEGQGYAKARLQARIRQLDAIAAAKQEFATGATGTTLKPSGMDTTSSQAVTATTKTELQLILQSIIDALYGAQSGQTAAEEGGEEGEEIEGKDAYESVARIVFSDAVRALSIIIRTASAPETTAEDLEDILAPVVQIEQLLLALTDPDYVEQLEKGQLAAMRLTTTKELFNRIHQYLDRMSEGINLSPKERVALSKALVRTLGFAKFAKELAEKKTSERSALERTARSRLFTPQGREEFDDEDDDNDEDRFNEPAERREDAEQRGNVATFDTNERDVFGDNSGEFLSYPTEGRPQRAQYIENVGAMGPTAEEAAVIEAAPTAATASAAAPLSTGLTPEEVRRIRGMPMPQGPPSVATRTTRSSRSTQSTRQTKSAPKRRLKIRLTTAESSAAPPPPPPAPRTTNWRAQIDALRTPEEAKAFATRINSASPIPTQNKKPITIYSGSKLSSIKKNLRTRFGV